MLGLRSCRRLARLDRLRRRRWLRAPVRTMYVVALSLFLLHGAFHVWGDAMLLGYGSANPLGWLLGPSELGHVVHVLEFVAVILGLSWGLWRAL